MLVFVHYNNLISEYIWLSRLAAKPHAAENQVNAPPPRAENNDRNEHVNFDEIEEEEDPYNICPEDIYDTVDTNSTYNPGIQNRPPAPIPRPEAEPEPERPATYISRGLLFTVEFLHTGPAQGRCLGSPYHQGAPKSTKLAW